MSDRKWGFFPFDAMDYKAAQAYLDKKAVQGWVLDKLYCKHFARFVPADGRYHCVDIDTPHMFEDDLDWNYVEFCEDASWELVASPRNMLLFRSKPGQHPAPLQTDEGMEMERFWKRYVRRNLIVNLILLLILVPIYVLLFSLGRGESTLNISELLCSNSIFLAIPLLLFVFLGLLRSLYHTAAVWVRYRRSGAMPRSDPARAWLYGLLGFVMAGLAILWWCVHMADGFLNRTVDVAWSRYSDEYTATPELCQSYPVITAADLGLEYSEDSRYLDGWHYLLVDVLEYDEIADGEEGATHILTTMRYECANETVAQWMYSARKSETSRGVDYLWGKLDWGETTSAHGFDQISFTRNNSCLILQEGDTVVLTEATGFDLTEYLDTLRERLELDAP